jgi:DNA-binding CsgD family transcriptional regulator/tetratricopeptide (TPR) repeat protein
MPPAIPRDAPRRIAPIRQLNPLAAGRAALARGDWLAAKDSFDTLLLAEESPEALEGLALAGWWLDLADVVFGSRERAYLLYRQRGDAAAAARVAVWVAWDYAAFRGEGAVASGWLERAHQLLDGLAEQPEHAWLALREGVLALLEEADPDRSRALAAEAIRIGRATGALGFEMLGRALHGFASVVAGEVAQGMRELDGVSAAVLAGEIEDPVAIGLSCCYMVNACERVRDAERAMQWCDRLRGFCATWGLRPLLAVCRTQYASVCVWRGAWLEAETELTAATAALLVSRPAMSAEGQARLGGLRRLQGRLDEAAALFEAAGLHPLAALGRAALALDRGEPGRAADLAERYLRHLPPGNRTDRAPGLELLVRARAECGDLQAARIVLAELEGITIQVGAPPLRASGCLASGWVAWAAGDAVAARRHFEDAVDLFQGSGTPYETARARIELARALAQLGQTAAAREELQGAIGVLARMSAAHDLSRARQLESELSFRQPEPAGRGRIGGLTRRELQVIRLIAEGLGNPAIAQRLILSEHTVHRHVANILARLDVPSRSAAVARAAQLGLLADD